MLRLPMSLSLLVLVSCEAGGARSADLERATARPTAEPERWQLGETPVFLNAGGSVYGDSVFYTVVLHGAFLQSGQAVVSLTSENAAVVIDSVGEIVDVLGGSGDGPGEFRLAPWILQAAGRWFLMDLPRARVLEVHGTVMTDPRSFPRPPRTEPAGVLDDGTLVWAPGVLGSRDRELEDLETGLSRTPYLFESGQQLDTVMGPASPPLPLLPNGPQGAVFVLGDVCLPKNHYAALGSRLVIADAASGLIMSLERSGSVDTLYQSTDQETITQEMVDDGLRYMASRELEPAEQEVFKRRLGRVGDPMPSVWGALLADGSRLWLRRAVPCFRAEPAELDLWDVIDVERGVRVASVEVLQR